LPERIFSADQVHRVGARLRDAVLAPTLWPEILDELCAAAGAADAALLPSDPEAFARPEL